MPQLNTVNSFKLFWAIIALGCLDLLNHLVKYAEMSEQNLVIEGLRNQDHEDMIANRYYGRLLLRLLPCFEVVLFEIAHV